MKKVFRWLDDSLEETLMVITLILMTVILPILVRRVDKVSFCVGRIPERELLYEKMYFH